MEERGEKWGRKRNMKTVSSIVVQSVEKPQVHSLPVGVAQSLNGLDQSTLTIVLLINNRCCLSEHVFQLYQVLSNCLKFRF